MKTNIRTVSGILAAVALATAALPAQAQITASQTSTITSWLGGTSLFETGATPQGNSGGSTADNDSWGGNANGTAGFGALGMTFIAGSSGTLGNVQLVLSGATMTFNVELYDMGPTPSGYPGTVGGAAPITQINNVGGAAPSGTLPTLSGGTELLTAGDNFTYTAAAGTVIETLTFGGTDSSVSLVTGELYLLSLDPTANADSTWWQRGGVPVTGYNGGEGLNADGVAGLQNFEGKSSIRDFDLNVTAAPEPTTLALAGLGGLASLVAFRRKK